MALSTLVVPLLDVARVFLHRVRKHRNPFLPDRNHLHHKLLRCGMRKTWALVVILGLVLMYIGLNRLLLWLGLQVTFVLLADVVIWVGIHLFLNDRIKAYSVLHPEMASSVAPVVKKD